MVHKAKQTMETLLDYEGPVTNVDNWVTLQETV